MNTSEYKREKALKSTKGINLGNRPITEKSQKELPIGFHTHPIENRRQRRQWEKGEKLGNNRKRTIGRLQRKVVVFTKQYNELRKEQEDIKTKIFNLNSDEHSKHTELWNKYNSIEDIIFTSTGKLRRTMYKTIVIENVQNANKRLNKSIPFLTEDVTK